MLRPLRERVPAHVRLILAGGLTAGNAAEAIDAVRPDGVDVSSGVERVVGEKSAERIRAFVAAARSARDSGIEA
jgi:phosphoribosylanthranilate isomerase